MHPLKLASLLSWASLLLLQLSLLWPGHQIDLYWAVLVIFPLTLPAKGLWCDRRYTYKWIGFLTLVYFCIGISELVSNPELKLYALGTTLSSTILFLAAVYYTRFLAVRNLEN